LENSRVLQVSQTHGGETLRRARPRTGKVGFNAHAVFRWVGEGKGGSRVVAVEDAVKCGGGPDPRAMVAMGTSGKPRDRAACESEAEIKEKITQQAKNVFAGVCGGSRIAWAAAKLQCGLPAAPRRATCRQQQFPQSARQRRLAISS